MGRPLASRLIDAGYAVHVYDVSGDAVERLVADGARAAGSAAAVAENAPFVLTVLPEAADVRRALLGASGAVEGAASGSIFFDASTIDPMSIQEIGGELGGTGITVLDGGVAGNPAMARDGIATLMVGGPQEAVEESRPILEALCGTLIYTGELGTAKTVKLVNNMVGAVSMAAVAEAFDLALKAGVEPEIIYDSMMGSWGTMLPARDSPPYAGVGRGQPGRRRLRARFQRGLHDQGPVVCLAHRRGAGVVHRSERPDPRALCGIERTRRGEQGHLRHRACHRSYG